MENHGGIRKRRDARARKTLDEIHARRVELLDSYARRLGKFPHARQRI